MQEKNVPNDLTFNLDEQGLTEGKTKTGKVIGDALCRRSIVSESDNCTWVSILECINAIGRRLPPCVVFTN
jgi:hypothetical protein